MCRVEKNDLFECFYLKVKHQKGYSFRPKESFSGLEIIFLKRIRISFVPTIVFEICFFVVSVSV